MINLLDDHDGALLAMAALEGSGWLHDQEQAARLLQEHKPDTDTALWALLRALPYTQHTVPAGLWQLWLQLPVHGDDCWIFQVYGSGGWHRYFLRASGRVDFSTGHAAHPAERTVQRARVLGFHIH